MTVEILLFDHDRLKHDDPMGRVTLTLSRQAVAPSNGDNGSSASEVFWDTGIDCESHVLDGTPCWIPLGQIDGLAKDQQPQGELCLSCRYIPPPPTSIEEQSATHDPSLVVPLSMPALESEPGEPELELEPEVQEETAVTTGIPGALNNHTVEFELEPEPEPEPEPRPESLTIQLEMVDGRRVVELVLPDSTSLAEWYEVLQQVC